MDGQSDTFTDFKIRLEVQDLCCIRDDTILFEKLNFTLDPYQILLLQGNNGSGKTSLLRILCGIRLPDSGTICWCGRPIARLRAAYFEQITYIGHMDGIKRDLTVEENLTMAQSLGNPSILSIAEVLDRINLYGYNDVLTLTLSAGQRRRLALARLLVTQAPLWILDEPFTALDNESIGIIEKLMEMHTQNGGMVVLTSHHQVNLEDTYVQRVDLSA